MHQMRNFVLLLSATVLVQPLLAVPIFWFLPWKFPTSGTTTASSSSATTAAASSANGASNSSNVSVAIGNRVNTSTGLDDYGTNISNVQINVNRMRRSIDARQTIQLDGLQPLDYDRMMNGSFITIGEHTIRLPANVSNVTVNTYLVNGIPIDAGMNVAEVGTMEPSVNVNDGNPLVTAVKLFRNFLTSFFNNQASTG
ncbi:gSG10 salivary mucin [Anopheles sinensis]|uniref:GSG10 salivary mucin n=1 Tax=Anopheles sinensis TaxID=74873 RepID=A0A084WNS7_ANOSI|nr:gSG10 salivary mucin [Anopheles sinensis]